MDPFPYPSPRHTITTQSPGLCQSLHQGSELEEVPFSPTSLLAAYKMELEGGGFYCDALEPGVGAKRVESYIAGLVHKRTQPARSCKLRTSLNSDSNPKGVLRQSSLCLRNVDASSPRGSVCESLSPPPPSQPGLPPFEDNLPSSSTTSSSSSRHRSPWNSGLAKKAHRPEAYSAKQPKMADTHPPTPQALMKHFRAGLPLRPTSLDYQELSYRPTRSLSPQENYYEPLDLSPQAPQALSSCRPEMVGQRSRDGGYRPINGQFAAVQQPFGPGFSSGRQGKVRGGLGGKVDVSPCDEGGSREKGKASGRKCRFNEENEAERRSGRKASSSSPSRSKKTSRSQSENSLLGKQIQPQALAQAQPQALAYNRPVKYHTVERDEVMLVKASRQHRPGAVGGSGYRRWRSTAEICQGEAQAPDEAYPPYEPQSRLRRHHKPPAHPVACGYPGSDSEYSAECDPRPQASGRGLVEMVEAGGYEAPRLGDSESSLSEAESPGFSSCCSSDTDESGGLVWPQQVLGPSTSGPAQDSSQPKVFVKIKASHALKKKILRFRSGSLKVMTTV
uniref:Uncharacterized protein n=1 Tax=Callorhinchus milii TaxID=7868 RepID=A0A4W3GM08_CALMI